MRTVNAVVKMHGRLLVGSPAAVFFCHAKDQQCALHPPNHGETAKLPVSWMKRLFGEVMSAVRKYSYSRPPKPNTIHHRDACCLAPRFLRRVKERFNVQLEVL